MRLLRLLIWKKALVRYFFPLAYDIRIKTTKATTQKQTSQKKKNIYMKRPGRKKAVFSSDTFYVLQTPLHPLPSSPRFTSTPLSLHFLL